LSARVSGKGGAWPINLKYSPASGEDRDGAGQACPWPINLKYSPASGEDQTDCRVCGLDFLAQSRKSLRIYPTG